MLLKTIVFVVIAILTLTKFSECAVKLTWPPNLNEKRIVCYYGSWAASRTGAGKFTPEDIDPFLCTHLIYAYARLTKNVTFEPSNKVFDIEQGGYANFTGLKNQNKALLTGISLGGWTEGPVKFASIAANSTKRNIFIKNCIKYLRQHKFDFFCLDWQFPTLKDRHSYSSFIRELREAFEIEALETNRFRLGLALTLPTLVDHVNRGYDIAAITKYVDCMHALTYNYHTEFEPLVYHHSQLYAVDDKENSDSEVNANYTMSFYLASGAEHQKLALGISTYGQVYKLRDSNLTDIGSPAVGPGLKGEQTNQSGFLAYYEICRKIKDDHWTVKQPYPDAMGQYAYKGNQWVGYDDENIMRKKGEYVANNKLGGMMFWLLEYDDFNGYCGGKQFPLIKAAKEGLQNALKNTHENIENERYSRQQRAEDKDSLGVATMTRSTIKENTSESSSIPVTEMKSSITNNINPIPASSNTPGIITRSLYKSKSNNGVTGLLEIFETNDDKYFNQDEILKPLGNFMQESGGIEGLRRFLTMLETPRSKSKPMLTSTKSPPQVILGSRFGDSDETTQDKGADLQGGVSQPSGSEESKNGSRILNIVFNIDF